MSGSDRALSRVAGLLRKAERTDNPHEAQIYFARAQQLATRHSIDLALARATQPITTRATPVMREISIGEPGARGLSTYVQLFLAIARANDVCVDIATNSTWVVAFGMESDIAAVEVLYAGLLPQMIHESRAYLRSPERRAQRAEGRAKAGITARLAFQHAFAIRIGRRLTEVRDITRAQALSSAGDRGAGPSTALVLRGKELEVADFYTSHSRARGTWRAPRRRRVDGAASIAGDQAGRRARLTEQQSLPAAARRLSS
ncbi:DUF2786 domain-containing protein [Nocardia sp. NPDC059691]|uniref:DUF2786 domain-containing protein n=1 Tax=Nocardia sp. NPDC059691 TaxID=3346908 RepID=UPI0036771B26